MNSAKNLLALTLTLAGTFTAHSAFAAVSMAELTELQFHKVNQLVAVKKIDGGFVSHLKGLSLTQPTTNGGPFVVTFIQEADSAATAAKVAVQADADGKPLGFAEARGTAAASPANWGGKSPLDLAEKAMEYIADTDTNPILTPFRNGFTTATIEPSQTANGLFGLVSVNAGPSDGVLKIVVDLNGKIVSATK